MQIQIRSRCLSVIIASSLLAMCSLTSTTLAQADVDRSAKFEGGHMYGQAAPLEKPDHTIRIATYNIENYFDDVDDPKLSGEWDDLDLTTASDRLEEIAKIIRTTDADIIALQEVESLDALTRFRDRYLPNMGYEYIASEDVGYYRGVECSILSRYEITNVEVRSGINLDGVERAGPGWSDVPMDKRRGLTIQRSPIRVDIRISDTYELTVFSLHHKASGRARYHREAEAIVINQWIDEIEAEDSSRNIIVMGDFNAAPWDKSLRLYLENGFADTLSHRIIPHWNNADQTEANLFKTHSSGRVIDYVLMNSAAFQEFAVGSAHVYAPYTPPSSWNWREDPFPAGYASDHYPVIVDLVPIDQP